MKYPKGPPPYAIALALLVLVLQLMPQVALAQIPLPEKSSFEQYLRTEFPENDEESYEVLRMYDFEPDRYSFVQYLKEYRLFSAWIEGGFLDAYILPTLTSQANFATDGTEILYLGGGAEKRKVHFEKILKAEQLPMHEVDPSVLADLFCSILLDNGNRGQSIVAAVSDLESKPEYEIDTDERTKYANRIVAPIVREAGEQGWILEFYALEGWMHETNTLMFHRYSVSRSYDIGHMGEVISERVFSRVPDIVY